MQKENRNPISTYVLNVVGVVFSSGTFMFPGHAMKVWGTVAHPSHGNSGLPLSLAEGQI